MCRSRSVGVGTVVVDVEPARVESDTHAGIDASLQPLRIADFVLQLVSVLLILLFLALALYVVYKRRRLLRMRRFSDFGTQTDSEIGAREDLDKVIEAVSNLQHQVLTLGLERESIRRLEEMKRTNPVSQSQELYSDLGDRQAADFGSMVPQH
jgi:flagellar biogenesis protein FliO